MARKSTIKSKPNEWRRHFDKLIREDRWTLDEILSHMREQFPDENPPSRSAAGRYSKKVKDLGARMREIEAAGTALVKDLGEDPHDRAGQLMVNAMTTVYTHLVLDANDEDKKLSIKEAADMARGARAVMETRKMSLTERQEIARIAREELVREQRGKLDALGKSGEIPPETLAKIIKAAYDL